MHVTTIQAMPGWRTSSVAFKLAWGSGGGSSIISGLRLCMPGRQLSGAGGGLWDPCWGALAAGVILDEGGVTML